MLDLGLPDQRAGDVLRWLHAAQARVGGPPWIVVSAQDPHNAARKYGPLGDHFLAKPFDPWQLVAQLDELLGRRG